MPVEIKELIIRAVVTGESESSAGGPFEDREIGGNEEIVQECVRAVLKILEKSKER